MRSKQHTKGKKGFQQETDFGVFKCLDVYSRFLGFLSDFQVSGPMPASDSKWTNALSESSHLIPDGNTRKWLWPALLLGEKLFLAQWCGWQARVFFFPYVMDVQLGCWKLGQCFYVWGRRLERGRTQHLSVLQCFAFSLAACHPRGLIWGAISIWSIMEFNGEGPVLARHLSRSMEEKKAGHLCSWTALRE